MPFPHASGGHPLVLDCLVGALQHRAIGCCKAMPMTLDCLINGPGCQQWATTYLLNGGRSPAG